MEGTWYATAVWLASAPGKGPLPFGFTYIRLVFYHRIRLTWPAVLKARATLSICYMRVTPL